MTKRDWLVIVIVPFSAVAGSLVLVLAAHLNLTNERLPPTTTILETLPRDASDAAFGFDAFRGPQPRVHIRGGALDLSGWAYDRRTRTPFLGGAVMVDGRVVRVVYGTATVELALREGTPVLAQAGWYVRFPRGSFGPGRHVMSFAFICQDAARADVVRDVATIVDDSVHRARSAAER